MKTYIKFFLLLFTFTLAHTTVMATELAESPAMEYKVKSISMDSEENSKDFKLDMLISHPLVDEMLGANSFTPTITALTNDAYLTSPFKPPRA